MCIKLNGHKGSPHFLASSAALLTAVEVEAESLQNSLHSGAVEKGGKYFRRTCPRRELRQGSYIARCLSVRVGQV
jgi:hypothetical protein